MELTQQYVDGGWLAQEVPVCVKTILEREDDIEKKEDDRKISPTLRDDIERLVTLEELTDSKRDEAGHHQPTMTSLSPAECGDQAEGGHTPVVEVMSTDTLQGSSLVPSVLGPTVQHGDEWESKPSVEDRHFDESLSSGGSNDTWESPRSGNVCPDTMTGIQSQEPHGCPGTSTSHDNLDILTVAASTPSSGKHC